VPELRQRIPGNYAGGLGEAVDRIEEQADRPVPQLASLPAANRVQAEAYRASRPHIEIEIREAVADLRTAPETLQTVNAYFGAALESALDLGSVSYLRAELTWVRALLAAAQVPDRALEAYLLAYAAAMRRSMGKAAEEAAVWLETWSAQESLE
jgi:hypothetical protein